MRLNSFYVYNYRSLRDIRLSLPRLAVFVGVNAAGKTNFCDSLDFLSEVYRLGLRVAVARKGGYESICFRRARRSKGAIEFEVDMSLSPKEVYPRAVRLRKKEGDFEWRVKHSFAFKATSERIGAEFKIDREELVTSLNPIGQNVKKDEEIEILNVEREGMDVTLKYNKDNVDKIEKIFRLPFSRRLSLLFDEGEEEIEFEAFSETELFQSYLQKFIEPFQTFSDTISTFRVFQISPRSGREPGVPIPQPELERFGNNLPTIMAYFRDNHPKVFKKLISKMRTIVPELETIDIEYVYRKRYGLIFFEKGISRPWTAEDVSDGTIQTLAMLTAILDPRSKVIAIEEPENSVHSWILSNMLETCREASGIKSILLTTHSMNLIDILDPGELYVVYKTYGETKIQPAEELDADLHKILEKGEATLGEYIHAGGIPKIVPSEEY